MNVTEGPGGVRNIAESLECFIYWSPCDNGKGLDMSVHSESIRCREVDTSGYRTVDASRNTSGALPTMTWRSLAKSVDISEECVGILTCRGQSHNLHISTSSHLVLPVYPCLYLSVIHTWVIDLKADALSRRIFLFPWKCRCGFLW